LCDALQQSWMQMWHGFSHLCLYPKFSFWTLYNKIYLQR
jgi:hypothetical protein